MKKQTQGSVALLGATIIWGTAFVAQSVGMDLIGPFTFQTVRCALAVLFLFPLSFLFDKKSPGQPNSWELWRDHSLWKGGLLCGIPLFIAADLQQIGLVYTDAGKAGFITAMYIVLVPILGIFLHRKPQKSAVVSVFIAVIGLYMLSCMGASSINIGDIFLMCCAFAFAVQIHFIDKFAASQDGLRLNCVQALVVSVLSLICTLLFEEVSWKHIAACWLPLLYTGILSMGIAYSLQIFGQQRIEPTKASLIMSLESVFAVLGGSLILKETMTPWEIRGCILVFTAVVISQISPTKIQSGQ